jgi:hypothetical protein
LLARSISGLYERSVELLDYETNANVEDLYWPLFQAVLVMRYLEGKWLAAC